MLVACKNNSSNRKTVYADSLKKYTSTSNLQYGSSIYKQVQKTIKLNYDFEINVGQKEDFEKFETYTLFILTHNNKLLYIDTSLTEYEFGDSLYPIVRQLNNETYEVLVEVNDRPNKNYLKYLKVNRDQIVCIEKLPTFISKATNLDNDDNLEFAGFQDWGETWGDKGSLTAYNPLIYYELNPYGITLDSTLTIHKSKEIYGNFYGFKYNAKVIIKTSVDQKWNKEIKRIKAIR